MNTAPRRVRNVGVRLTEAEWDALKLAVHSRPEKSANACNVRSANQFIRTLIREELARDPSGDVQPAPRARA